MHAALPQAKALMTTQNRRTTAREAGVTNPPLTQLAANLNGLRIRSARASVSERTGAVPGPPVMAAGAVADASVTMNCFFVGG